MLFRAWRLVAPLLAVSLLLVAECRPLQAGDIPVPLTDEFDVPDQFDENQWLPHVSFSRSGRFAVTWTDATNIKVRQYTGNGEPIGGEILVNQTTIGNQNEPRVAYIGGAELIVAWTDYNGADGAALGALAQRVNAQGQRTGPEFIVSETTEGSQWAPQVVVNERSGRMVFMWVDSIPGDGSNAGVFARLFDQEGNPLSGEFLVNQTITAAQVSPSIAMFEDASFVCAWQDRSGQDGSGSRVCARLYAPNGTPRTNEIQVNQSSFANQETPWVCAHDDFSFTVGFTDQGGADGSGSGVFFRRFDRHGLPLSDEIRASERTLGDQGFLRVATDGSQSLLATWADFSGIDGSGAGVYTRAFTIEGVPLGPDVLVNQTTASTQFRPSVAMGDSEHAVIVWEDQGGADGDGFGVYGRRWFVEEAAAVPAASAIALVALALALAAAGWLCIRSAGRS